MMIGKLDLKRKKSEVNWRIFILKLRGRTYALLSQSVISEMSPRHPLFRDLPANLQACESCDIWQSCSAALI